MFPNSELFETILDILSEDTVRQELAFRKFIRCAEEMRILDVFKDYNPYHKPILRRYLYGENNRRQTGRAIKNWGQ